MPKNTQSDIIKKTKRGLKKKSRERYQKLSTEEIEKRQQCGREPYKNLPEVEKQKLVDYRKKKHNEMRKTPFYSYKTLFSSRKSFFPTGWVR